MSDNSFINYIYLENGQVSFNHYLSNYEKLCCHGLDKVHGLLACNIKYNSVIP